MKLTTTTIGAYPKPNYMPIFDWFQLEGGKNPECFTALYDEAINKMGTNAENIFVRAARDVIADQEKAGIDIPTDGEVRRENYIHYHCRHLDGIDFEKLTKKEIRNSTHTVRLPTITSKIYARESFLPHDWLAAQASTELPVKVTMPGPMTIGDTVADAYYENPKARGADLAKALNAEVLALAEAGCTQIQIDEPVFARRVGEALDYGFSQLERCFEGLPNTVTRNVHMCCGYPERLDIPDYPKAPKECYFELAEAIEDSCIDAISIEDAHRQNDLALLTPFKTTKVILGVVCVARSRLETVDEIQTRLCEALKYIDSERLIAAPDCGLGLLGQELALAKLENLCQAAQSL
ncbi:MAG: cobalamin-independent methionine synthase II family protein [Pseudomonadota bacterium]|nr:cobalamin-independent methionine synthase II family protein [Pseudomonadota bacterium]